MILRYYKLQRDAYAPTKEKDPADAGWDLRSREGRILRPGESHRFEIGLALQWEISEEEREWYARSKLSFYGQLSGRSGLASDFAIAVLGGVVDRNYIGPVAAVLVNTGFWRDGVLMQIPWTIAPGDKICQIVPKIIPDVREAKESGPFDATLRGSDGFMSTGR